ncbi:MAG: hypothetical protein Q8P41_19890 [Pseudomonadota bacterium]|nr:hypothetical protein [Pseudomonadota bacterium]
MILALVAFCHAETVAAEATSTPALPTNRIAELSLARVETGATWVVRDGRAHEIDARTWALLTGDIDVLGKVEASRRKGGVFGWGLVVGGGVVALSSAIPLFTLEDALGTNESVAGFDELGTRNDIRVATAFSLIGAGAVLAGTGFAARAMADHRSLDLTRHLDAAAADARIAAYNRQLAETLTVVPMVVPAEMGELPEDVEEPVKGASEGAGLGTALGAPGEGAPVVGPAPGPAQEAAPAKEAAPGTVPAPDVAPAKVPPQEAAPAKVPPPDGAPAAAQEAAPAKDAAPKAPASEVVDPPVP